MFLDAIILVLHIYYHFLLEKQIFRSSKWERPRNICGTHLWDVPGTKWWDVLGTSLRHRLYMFFNFNPKLILKLFWQFPQDFIVNCSSKKSVNSIETKKKKKRAEMRHDEFWKILLKPDLSVLSKVYFLMLWH